VTPAILKPGSLDETLQILSREGDRAKLLAGGTALVLLLRNRLIVPATLVDLSRVPDMDGIRKEPEGLQLGPMVSLHRIQSSTDVRQGWPGLALACRLVGNVRVRHQATLGGNLAEADYASDPPAMLLALDTRLAIAGPNGRRTVPLADFILGFYTTILLPDEVITGILVPTPPEQTRMTYLKYRARSSEDRPCVGVAAVARFSGRRCLQLNVAVGAACEVPRRIPELEAQAVGQELDDPMVDDLASQYAAQIDTLEDLRGSASYRKQMIRVHVGRAIKELRDGRG
jgi:carbon-monoxide dehydrogenase medium subunit